LFFSLSLKGVVSASFLIDFHQLFIQLQLLKTLILRLTKKLQFYKIVGLIRVREHGKSILHRSFKHKGHFIATDVQVLVYLKSNLNKKQ